MRYILYARKSSEADDRQAPSIVSQKESLRDLAARENLTIAAELCEARSAWSPGRPVFADLLARIRRGEADGIICWKLDRLSRNPIDDGQVKWLLQEGIIQHIRTFERSYYPPDNVLLMAVEFGMATQYSRDLSTNVKRGLQHKAASGWLPTRAPVGYLNNKNKEPDQPPIVRDPVRWSIVRKCFDDLLSRSSGSTDALFRKAISDYGLTWANNRAVTRSNFYRLLNNPFYVGDIVYGGNIYPGSHDPMLTRQEWAEIQRILHQPLFTRSKGLEFPFTGLIRCGGCGAQITAERRERIQQNGNHHVWTYYHCTRRRDPSCRQPAITSAELEQQILSILDKIEISPEIHKWAMSVLRDENAAQERQRGAEIIIQRREYDTCRRRIGRLIDMRSNGELTAEEYAGRRSALLAEKERLEGAIQGIQKSVDRWIEKAEKVLTFTELARDRFLKGDSAQKRTITSCLGSNLLLQDRKLLVDLHAPLLAACELAQPPSADHSRFEPTSTPVLPSVCADIGSNSPVKLGD